MKKIIKGILGHKFIIIIISILLIAFGIYSYINIPKQEMPEINPVFGYVQITAPGLNSEEIKDRIARPIEDIITNYSSVDNFTSTSVDNACIIVIDMKLEDVTSADTLLKIKNDILNSHLDESISDINFVTDMNTADVIYAVHSSDVSEYQLMHIARDLADELAKVEKVAKTEIDSAYSEEIIIEVDNDKINDMPITLLDIYNLVYANGIELPMGGAEIDGNDSSILVNGNYSNLDDIRNIIIYTGEEGPVKISDIAAVEKRNTDNKKIYEFNGESVAFVEIFFDEDIDFTVLGDEITAATDDFTRDIDKDVSISAMTFSPDHVQAQVDQVMSNLLLCIAIVMGVVLIGLGIRNSLAIAVTIPVTALATIGILYILGYQLQLMSIAGMIVSIGILVDNSIVISEATQHNLDTGMKRRKSCVKAVRDNYLPVLTSTLTTIVVFVSLLFLPGIAGEVAFTLPLTILTSIIISYIVSITLTPVLASVLFKKHRDMKKHGKKLNKAVNRTLNQIFKITVVPTIIAFIILGGLTYFVVRDTEIDIMPKTEKSVVYINYEYNDINDSEGTYEFAKEIEQLVKKQKDVVNYAFSQGGDLPKFYMTMNVLNNLPNTGRFFIEYDCETVDLPDYIARLEEDLDTLDDRGIIIVNRLQLSIYAAPIQVILSSDDYNELIEKSGTIFADVQELDGYQSGELGIPGYKTDLEISIDRGKMAAAGLTLAETEQQIAVAVNGLSEKLYKDNGNLLNLRVISGIAAEDELLGLNIRSSSGVMTKLSEIAQISKVENLEYIRLYNGVPSVVMDVFNTSDKSTYSLESDIRDIIDNSKDITATFKGDNETLNEILSGLSIALGVAVFIIYLIMYFQFDSLRQPLIILTTIPLSFIGSLLAILIFGEKISITTLLGIASLVGIVVNNGILLVEYINVQRKAGDTVYSSCIKAVSRRIRPIMLASLTTILGVVPLALTGGDFFRPMAVTFMGGMMTSALLVLIIVPGLYYVTYRRYDKK